MLRYEQNDKTKTEISSEPDVQCKRSFMFKVERKHKEECNVNREKSWQEMLKFLREEWQV